MNSNLSKKIRKILDKPFWIPEVKPKTEYSRLHDDHDGTKEGCLIVSFEEFGDAFIYTDLHPHIALRFRTLGGGGDSPRVRNALIILAEAIRLDNEDHPNK